MIVHPRSMATWALDEFMVAMYGSKYHEKTHREHLGAVRKEWARRRREGLRWLTLSNLYGTGVLLLP